MRISIVSTAVAYPHTDALARLVSVLLRRGDDVQVFACAAVDLSALLPTSLVRPAAPADLQAHPYFRASDLYVYHATENLDLLETLLTLDRGVVVLWAQTTIGSSEQDSLSDGLIRLVAASDLIVCDDPPTAAALQRAGASEADRLHIVPPAVSFSEYTPSPPDAVLRRELGLLGKRVVLAVQSADATPPPQYVSALVASVRQSVDTAVLAVAPSPGPSKVTQNAPGSTDSVVQLPPAQDLRPYYDLADLLLARAADPSSRQRALEAMACGVPVCFLDEETQPLADAAVRLLTDDAAYGAAVRAALDIAAEHSLEVFAQAWGAAIARACDWLPVRLTPQPQAVPAGNTVGDAPIRQRVGAQAAIDSPVDATFALEQLKIMAGVALHDYEVRSPTPIFGPFIAWVRRNLTSHLRRPYIDPILDQQEAFNLRAVNALEDLARKLAAYEHAQRLDRSSMQAVDPQVHELLDQVDRLLETLAGDESHTQLNIIRSALAQVGDLLAKPADLSRPPLED